MALITGAITTLGTVSTLLFQQPPGQSVVTITSDTASTSTCFIGSGTVVTTSNGTPLVPGGSISLATYVGSKGGPVSAVGAGSANTLGWIISSNR